MSKNAVYSPWNLQTIGTRGPDAGHISPSEALPPGVPNISPKPVFFVTSGKTQLLNYSFRTGEEFALEFMQDRANTRKPLVSITSDDRNIQTSYTLWGQEANISGDKLSKKLLTFASISETSNQGTNKTYPQEIYNSGSTRMKFLCNFGGRFLPRPVDGKLRYVGGEKHLIQISQRLSWQGLISKTTKLIRQAHIVKYHLPGEQVNVLISVASDDDVHHMIDECIVLEESKEWPTIYLFTDEDDEHHVHFVVGRSSDEDTEAQYIALINGYRYTGPGEKLSAQGPGSASASDLDQLMFDIDDAGSQTGGACLRSKRSQNIVTETSKESRIPLHKFPPIIMEQMTNQDCAIQSNKGEASSYPTRKSRNVNLASSMPLEFTYPSKWERNGSNSTSRQIPELQRTTSNISKIGHNAGRDKESVSSRMELMIPSDENNLRMPSLSTNFSSLTQHTSPVNKLLREQTETIVQSIQSNNSIDFQKLVTEPVGRSVYEMLASPSGDYQKPVYKCPSSDESMISTRCSSQEDTIPYSDTDQLNKISSTELQNKTEWPAPTRISGSNEAGAHILWDDTHISEQVFSVNTIGCIEQILPDVMHTDVAKKDNLSTLVVHDSEMACSPRPFTSSDKAAELQKNRMVHASGEKQQASPDSRQQDIQIVRSTSLGGEGNRMQIESLSEEVTENFASPISELEVHLITSTYVLMRANFRSNF